MLSAGARGAERPIYDVDFMVESFDDIPATLADEFVFRHIHPLAPPGRTVLQCVDLEVALRLDVFRALGDTMCRTILIDFVAGVPMRLISVEDLAARSARLALDLAGGRPTPLKYARDFLRLSDPVDEERAQAAWNDQRKTTQPESFRQVKRHLQSLIPTREGLLTTPEFSTDPAQICPRCIPTQAFSLADPSLVFSVLGYW